MQRRGRSVVGILVAGVFALVSSGCARTPVPPGPPEPTSPPAARPAVEPPKPPPAFTPSDALKDLHFAPGGVDVLKADRSLLSSAAGWLVANTAWLVLIEGHTDDRGAWEQNLRVSEQRARSVMSALVEMGVDAGRITIAGFGADRPICRDNTEACRARNRGVHFLLKPR